jgi:hypothetical protein
MDKLEIKSTTNLAGMYWNRICKSFRIPAEKEQDSTTSLQIGAHLYHSTHVVHSVRLCPISGCNCSMLADLSPAETGSAEQALAW